MLRFNFSDFVIDGAPEDKGVYLLFDGDELIYIGRALGFGVTIRSRLRDHLAGRSGRCTQAATHYSWELSSDPAREEAALLATFKSRFGRLPRCNERIG